MKKSIISMISLAFLLAGCGHHNQAANQTHVKLGDVMHQDQHISYLVKKEDNPTPTKDSVVTAYIVTQNGKQTVYSSDQASDRTLGDFKDKSDKAIIDMAKKDDRAAFQYEKKEMKQEIQKLVDRKQLKDHDGFKLKASDFQTQPETAIKHLDNMTYQAPQPQKVRIQVTEDETGNHSTREAFAIHPQGIGNTKQPEDVGDIEQVMTESGISNALNENKGTIDYLTTDKHPNHHMIAFDIAGGTADVYDKKYAFISQNDGELNLVTPVGKKTKGIQFDAPDSRYVQDQK